MSGLENVAQGTLNTFPIQRLDLLADGKAKWEMEVKVNIPQLISLFEGSIPFSLPASAAEPSADITPMPEAAPAPEGEVPGKRKRQQTEAGGRGPRMVVEELSARTKLRTDFFLVVSPPPPIKDSSQLSAPSRGSGGSPEGGGNSAARHWESGVGGGGVGGQEDVHSRISPSTCSLLCDSLPRISPEWQEQAMRYLLVGEVKRYSKLNTEVCARDEGLPPSNPPPL